MGGAEKVEVVDPRELRNALIAGLSMTEQRMPELRFGDTEE